MPCLSTHAGSAGIPTPWPRAALLAVLVALAGCGNKGPLYLPSSPEPEQAVTEDALPAPVAGLSALPDDQ